MAYRHTTLCSSMSTFSPIVKHIALDVNDMATSLSPKKAATLDVAPNCVNQLPVVRLLRFRPQSSPLPIRLAALQPGQ